MSEPSVVIPFPVRRERFAARPRAIAIPATPPGTPLQGALTAIGFSAPVWVPLLLALLKG